MRIGRLAAVTVATLTLGGCWIQPGFGPTRQGFTPFDGGTVSTNVGALDVAWQRETVSFPNRPIVVGSRVVITGGPRIMALDASTGDTLWARDHTDPIEPTYSPSLGDPVWRYDGRVHVAANVFRFGGSFAYEIDTGVSTGSLGTGPSMIGAPAFGPDSSATVRGSFTPAGSLVELITTGVRGLVSFSTTPGSAPPITDPMLVDDQAWVGAGTRLMRFTLDACSPIPAPFPPGYCFPSRTITFAGNVETPAAIDSTRIAITDSSGYLGVYDEDLDAVAWNAVIEGEPAAPAVANGTIVVASSTGRIYGFAADGCGAPTCAPQWSGSIGGGVEHQPSVAGGVAYVATTSGAVLGFATDGCDAPTCPAIWIADANAAGADASPAAAPPVLAGGRIHVILRNGWMTSFARRD